MNRLAIILCGLILAALASASALADTVYTYTGNPFNQSFNESTGSFGSLPAGSFSNNDFITGSFTLSAPLGPNHHGGPTTPLTLSFTDGVTTIDSTNVSFDHFGFVTDASGNIVDWVVELGTTTGNLIYSESQNNNTVPQDLGCAGSYSDCAEVSFDPGTWAITNSGDPGTSPVPEPSSLLLLGTGVIGGFGVFRRKLAR